MNYMYSFGRFYKLTFGRNILKLVRFLLGLIIFSMVILLIVNLLGVIIGYLGLVKF